MVYVIDGTYYMFISCAEGAPAASVDAPRMYETSDVFNTGGVGAFIRPLALIHPLAEAPHDPPGAGDVFQAFENPPQVQDQVPRAELGLVRPRPRPPWRPDDLVPRRCDCILGARPI